MADGGHLGFSIWPFWGNTCVDRRPEHAYQIWWKSGLPLKSYWQKIFPLDLYWKYPKIGDFGQFRGQNLCINISHPQRHFLSPKHAFGRIICPNRSTMATCGYFQETKKKRKRTPKYVTSAYAGEVWGGPILTKFGGSYWTRRRNELCIISLAYVSSFANYSASNFPFSGFVVNDPYNILHYRAVCDWMQL